MTGGRVAGLALDPAQGILEPFVFEGLDLAAAVADEVVMVIPAGMSRLEPSYRIADLHALNEALVGEQVEDAIDARDSDAPALVTQAVEDLLGAQTALLPTEKLDHGSAGAAASVPGALKLRERLGRPLRHASR